MRRGSFYALKCSLCMDAVLVCPGHKAPCHDSSDLVSEAMDTSIVEHRIFFPSYGRQPEQLPEMTPLSSSIQERCAKPTLGRLTL